MTANQRRPGFRLPWSTEEDAAAATASDASASPEASAAEPPVVGEPPADAAAAASAANADAPAEGAATASGDVPAEPPAEPDAAIPAEKAAATSDSAPAAEASPTPPSGDDASPDFLHELVVAMRRVADEARQTGIADVRTSAEEQVKRVEADAETRRGELRARADADVAGIGEWAKAEAERIKTEAEQRVVARRGQLEQQLGAETARAESEAKALRERVAEYERELEAYHAQLAEINDPAAFAAAAKRMPRPPVLEGRGATATAAPAAPVGETTVTAAPADTAGGANGVTPPAPQVHPAEEEVLAGRLAELDAKLAAAPAADASTTGDLMTTEIVVSGLGSFGAITGFRQSLSGVDGVDGVALSLGQTGEFIFRATHRTGFDMGAAITTLEGDGATVEPRSDGSLHVTLDRAR